MTDPTATSSRLAEFRRWLRAKYATPPALAAAWRQTIGSFDKAEPPRTLAARRRDDLPQRLDWLEFLELADDDASARTSAVAYLDDVLPTGTPRARYERIRVAARELDADGRPPTVARALAQAGADAANPTAVRAAVMHGARLDAASATVEPALAEHVAAADWQPDRKMLILFSRLYARVQLIAGASRLASGDADPAFGFDRPLQAEGPALVKKMVDLAARRRLAFAVAGGDASTQLLARLPLVACPTLEALEAVAMARFDRYATGGGFLAIGPRVPVLDETLRRNDALARHFGDDLSDLVLGMLTCGDGAILTMPGYIGGTTIDFLAFESGLAPHLAADLDVVDSAVHRAGDRRTLYLANLSDVPVETTLGGEAMHGLAEVAGPRRVTGNRPRIRLAASEVSVWEVT